MRFINDCGEPTGENRRTSAERSALVVGEIDETTPAAAAATASTRLIDATRD